MSGDTTPPSPLINSSLINMLDANTSYIGNNSNGTDTRAEDKLGLALFALPQIPAWLASLYLSMLCLSILIGVPGNTLTVVAYARIKVKTSCDWYILIVAWADLVSCLFRSPVYIMEHLGVWLHHSNSDLCKVISWLSQITVCVSIFIFALIAIDRYIKLCHTFRWNISPTRARNISIIMILVNSVLAAPCLYIFENLSRGVCEVKVALQQNVLVKGYYSLIFVLFLMMFTAVVFCYINIAIKVRKAKRVGDAAGGKTTISAGRSAGADVSTVHSQDHVSKVTASNSFLGRQSASLPIDLSSVNDGGMTSSRRGAGNFRHNLVTIRTTQQLAVPTIGFRDLPRRIPTQITSYDQSSLYNPRKCMDGDRRVFIIDSSQSLANGESTTDHSSACASFSRMPMQTLGTSNGGASAAASLMVTELDTSERRQIAPRIQVTEVSRRKAAVRTQRNLRITGLLFVVTAVFILSWVPPYIAMVKGFYVGYTFPLSLGEMLLLSYGRSVYIINTFSNPIIYAALSAIYRRHVIDLWKALWTVVSKVRCRW